MTLNSAYSFITYSSPCAVDRPGEAVLRSADANAYVDMDISTYTRILRKEIWEFAIMDCSLHFVSRSDLTRHVLKVQITCFPPVEH